MKKNFALFPIALMALMLIINSCRDRDNDVIAAPETGTAAVAGIVMDMNGAKLAGVTVRSGMSEDVTDGDGKFELKDLKAANDIMLTFEKAQYQTTHKIVVTNDNRASWVDAAMSEIGAVATIGTGGGNITADGAHVSFPANAFVDSDGAPFSGNATVELTYCNPTDKFFCETFPGDFDGIREDGSEIDIESFGCISVEIRNGNEKLQLAENVSSQISLPIPSEIYAKAPATIPLWHFDTDKGRWVEDGFATKTGNNYVGTVSHFSYWNCDAPRQTSYLKGRVVDENNMPLPFATVKSTGVDYIGSSQTQCTEDGTFKIAVKADARAKLIAIYSGVYGQWAEYDTDPTPGNVLDIGDLLLDMSSVAKGGWEPVPMGDDNYYSKIYFIDQDNGWIVGNKLMRTKNGGQNWTELDIPKEGKDSVEFTKLYFLNENEGWLLGYPSYKTMDGGDSWQKFEINGISTLISIVFADDMNGWAASSSNIWKTKDGGNTWEELPQLPEKVYPSNMKFFDQKKGYIFGNRNVLKTTDAGETWSDCGPKNEEYNYFYDYSAPDQNTLYLIGRANREFAFSVLKSNDGGNSWVKTYDSPVSIYAMFFSDINNGWVVGQNGVIVHTSDGATTWNQQFSGSNSFLFDVEFLDSERGYVVGGNTFLKTETGGQGE